MRVLVADDEQTTRLVVRAAVQRLGHECLVAEDGDRAWARLHASPVDVLLTDWMMPGLDGPELCRRIRAHPADRYTYIILATSMSEREDILSGMQAGADDYLIKPLDPFAVQTRLIAAERVTVLHQQLAAFRTQLEGLNDELAGQARTDALTQLGNRRRLQEDLAKLHASARRHRRPYSIAMCDLDHFKKFNDTYGHGQGDHALEQVAAVLHADPRTEDSAYRYGGEEFVILFSDEHHAGALAATERIRAAVYALGIPHANNLPSGIMTISAGVSTFEPDGDLEANVILERADQALYVAKQRGRNQVASSSSAAASSPASSVGVSIEC